MGNSKVNTKNYFKQGGEVLVLGGAVVPATETQPAHLAALKVNYAANDLDTEAEIIAAINATNTRINAIMTALENIGVFAAS